MKFKEGVIIFIVFATIVLFNSNEVSAALGLTPAIMRADFKPYDKFLINFNVIGAEGNQKLEVYASGDLAEYVKFDKDELLGSEAFIAYIDLPGEIAKPGQHVIYIRVREIKDTYSGIGTKLEIGAAVVIKVPYPGRYAEIKSFVVNNTNGGESIVFYSEVENLGVEDLTLFPNIEVYSGNKLIDNFTLENRLINHTTSEIFTKIVEKGYDAGVYNSTINFNYGKIISQKTDFKVGILSIEIVNWSSKFIKGKISEFQIGVESKWNNDVRNVYAQVNVTKNGNQVDFFKTPSIELKKWEKSFLTGFFNCENLETGKYIANISLFYEDKITEKIVEVKVSNPPLSRNVIMAIGLGIFLFLVLIGIIVYLFLNRKKSFKK